MQNVIIKLTKYAPPPFTGIKGITRICDKYISNGAFYTKSETTYTEVTSFNINFTEKDIYVDVVDVSNMVANIFTVSNYTPLARQLGVKVDGVTHLFDRVSEEKVYLIG